MHLLGHKQRIIGRDAMAAGCHLAAGSAAAASSSSMLPLCSSSSPHSQLSRWPSPSRYAGLGLGLRKQKGSARLRTCAMRKEGDRDDGFSGEESPESLFMKELKRRGLAPPKYSASTETKTKEEEVEEIGAAGKTNTGRPQSVKSTPEWTDDRSSQQKRSMALNSEGIEGLIPRAVELIKLGGTFFLAFWPLILATLAFFVVAYWYFGPSFIHVGSVDAAGRPPYVDPYQLLEEESVPQDLGSLYAPSEL